MHLAVDPKGRACCVGAMEKQKIVYILNRDANDNLTINSPLEFNKNNLICFTMCGVDVGFENPIFACIEAEGISPVYSEEASPFGQKVKKL